VVCACNKVNSVVDKRHKENKTTQTKQREVDMSATQEKKVVGIRLEEMFRALLAQKAQENSRSLSGEIVHRLRRSLEAEASQNGHQA